MPPPRPRQALRLQLLERCWRLRAQPNLKILAAISGSGPDRLARLQREAGVVASPNHPGIAQIHGLEEGGGVSALVMELVEGEDLSERIARARSKGS